MVVMISFDYIICLYYLLLFKFKLKSLKHLVWLLVGIGIEFYAHILGQYDMYIIKKNPVKWDTASSTKNLSIK